MLSAVARDHALAGRPAEALELGREALELAEELELDEIRSHALNTVGLSRVALGDEDGVADVERSLEIALAINSPLEISRAYNNLGSVLGYLGDTAAAFDANEGAIETGYRFGAPRIIRWALSNRAWAHHGLGRWGPGPAGRRGVSRPGSGRPSCLDASLPDSSCPDPPCAREHRGRDRRCASGRRGRPRRRRPAAPRESARRCGSPLCEAGRPAEALQAVDELLELAAATRFAAELFTIEFAVTCDLLGRREQFSAAHASAPVISLARPVHLYLEGDLTTAAGLLDELRARPSAAYVRLRSDNSVEVERALEFWRSVGATHYVVGGRGVARGDGVTAT